MTAILLLGHQGGWDETLFVLTPVGIFAGLLALANKRARAIAPPEPPPDAPPSEADERDPDMSD